MKKVKFNARAVQDVSEQELKLRQIRGEQVDQHLLKRLERQRQLQELLTQYKFGIDVKKERKIFA